ncbi:hypothetical protein DVV91_09865 [Clostridium botulinum]|uniref:hypothetical protein n=1 Tax=Clostridium botulinum TaxID=1491 RepID=UPI0019678150|nr:hypothetical protein [Clostridium botulinum]MBN1074646.1 hypothetical protein [Clostridium botulinum]
MNRAEIKKLNTTLEQIKDLESINEEINGEGFNHWWKILTPNKETYITNVETRERFKDFIKSEIETLNKKYH